MRAVIYARYSTDMQREASIEDQVRICRRLIEERGWTVLEIYSDMGMSGASHLRPGFQKLMEDALAGRFNVVVAESIDRISRDQEHIAGFHKQMTFNGIVTHTVAEGAINELHIGLKGTMGALFLKDLAQKTHRGLEGRVRAGKSAGGISYGYRLDRQPQPDGTFTTGDRQIDPIEASVVRRIFEAYAGGESARTIAQRLNADGVPGPRAATWSFSTISGNWKRGTGILNNELYIGRLVWNRQRFIKDPATGKRQARPNPPEDWVTETVPELGIIGDELWRRVKVRQGAAREGILSARASAPGAPHTETARRKRYLFSGLLTCGHCGARYIMISDSRYGCSAARNRGTCTNRKSIKRSEVEERILSGLRDRLMEPELIEEFVAEYQRETQQKRRQALAQRGELERQLARVDREIDHIVNAITQGMFHPSMKARMDGLEAQRAELAVRLSVEPEPNSVPLHPGLAGIYRRKVEALTDTLNRHEARGEAVTILRGLIEKVVVHPEGEGNALELHGELGAILSLCGNEVGQNANAHARSVGDRQVTMVAGVGFEPTTFRL